MAAIMDSWNKINQQCRKIGEALALEVPPVLYKVEGDVWARQNQRLTALAGFLQDVAGKVEEIKTEVKTGEPAHEPKPKRGRGSKEDKLKTRDLTQDT